MKTDEMLRAAHGFSKTEIETFSSVITTEHFSIAEYKVTDGKKMSAFVHSHEHYEFIIPFETIPLLHYKDAVYIGEVGYCYPVNPFVRHGLEQELTSHLFSVVVERDFLDKIKSENGFGEENFKTRFLIDTNLLNLLVEFELSRDKNLISKIVKSLILLGLQDGADTRKPANRYALNMKEIILHMLVHFSDHTLSIKDVAAHSNYSYTYFTKAFHKYMNETPIHYLDRLRLSHAKRLMKETNLPLAEIARESGFKSASAFCEVFKRIVGCLPKEYREKYLFA